MLIFLSRVFFCNSYICVSLCKFFHFKQSCGIYCLVKEIFLNLEGNEIIPRVELIYMIIFHVFQKTVHVYFDFYIYAKFNTVYQNFFCDDELGNTMIAAFISIFSSSAFEFLIFDGKNIFLIQCIFHKLSIYIFSKLLYV